MRVKKTLLTFIAAFAVLALCLIPGMKARAERWIVMFPEDEALYQDYMVEYDLDSNVIKATILSNEGLMAWDGSGGSQSVASMFGMPFQSLTIGKDVTRLDNRALAPLTAGLGELIIEEGNTRLKLQDGMVVNPSGDTLYAVLKSYTDEHPGEITLPDTITTIGSHAFDTNKNIQIVNAPNVTAIGDWAFSGSSITKFTCNNLTSVGMDAFQNCEALEEITIVTDDGVTLNDASFSGCKKLKAFPYQTKNVPMNVFSKCEALESFTIGSTINEIGSYAFAHCTSLAEMTVPATVTSINSSAFDDCQNLKTVTFESSAPPALGDNVFTSCPSDMRIVVPMGAEEDYVGAVGMDYYDNIYETGVEKYGVFINGVQFSNKTTSVPCGSGTAVYAPDTKTLTLNNVTVNESTIVKLFGSWLHGGSIYSKVDDLTIVVNGTNTISADADGISTSSGSNVTIKGSGKLILDTLAVSDSQMASMYIGLGDDPTGVDGGDLTIDGPEIDASRELQANRNIIIKGNSKVVSGGRLRSNNNGDIKILENADVTAKVIDMGIPAEFSSHEVYQRDMHVVLDGGKLTLQGMERTFGDQTWTVNGILFCPNAGQERDPRGHVELKDGVIVIEKSVDDGKVFIDCPDENIVISSGFTIDADSSELTVEKLQKGGLTARKGQAEAPKGVELRLVDGKRLYYLDGVHIKDKFGFVEYKGETYLVANGEVATTKNGLANDPDHKDDWYFCANGRVVSNKSGLVQYPARQDNWFIVQNGKLDTTYSGFVDYNGGKFFVARGRLVRKDGLVQDPNHKADWYFLAKGQVQKQKTGVVIYNKAGFYVVNGKLDSSYNGTAKYNGKDFKVVKGRVQM